MLKPLDLQTMLPRSLDVQRLQQIQNTAPAIQQQQVSRELNQLHRESQNKVMAPPSSASGQAIKDEIPDGSARQSNLRYRRFYKKNKPKTESEDQNGAGPGQHIDIKI